jgi:DNA-binding response OmpR family regulator
MKQEPIKVLLIEDNPADARLIRELLVEATGVRFHLECADQLSKGLERLAAGGVDVLLLDLSLPDSQGLDTFIRVHTQAPEVPIMVLTGLYDEALAVKAMREGAQDYLVKGQADSNLLLRSMRYAIERHRLAGELEQAREQEQRQRELNSLEHFPSAPATTVTAQTFGLLPLRESLPDTFGELVQHYSDLMDLALEQRAYKVKHNISDSLRAIADQLGFLKCGPRDAVEIHTAAMKRKSNGATPQKVQAYVEEGRLRVLELMGYLVSYYRNYSMGASRSRGEKES